MIRERKPPFSPEAVVEEYAKLIRDYRCTTVYGNRYGGEWPREHFRKHGVNYEPAKDLKSELCSDLLPLLNSRAVDLMTGSSCSSPRWSGARHGREETQSTMHLAPMTTSPMRSRAH